MKLGKIAFVCLIGVTAVLWWSIPARAASCDRVAASESVPQYYPQGFFSDQNPLNPLALFPQDQLNCEATVRAVEAKVKREVMTAKYQDRASGATDPVNIRVAAADQVIGSSALSHGDRKLALMCFQRAELHLNGVQVSG